ncbi:hypothetical protein [Chloroflexus sp.]|uniref:hypothetical protein n=1 Tax=Chloroflexus sp. TaxID=1904827 RepID=UPI00298EE193|nr:hypothetical protein [Chloroflexus sp.]MDW8405892.1 hypothetical protein [Chloroflexus sp.]
MMRDLYHHEELSRRTTQERIAEAAQARLLPRRPFARRPARWLGWLLIRLGQRLLRYAIDRRPAHLSYARETCE